VWTWWWAWSKPTVALKPRPCWKAGSAAHAGRYESYGGDRDFSEFDLDAALARKPAVLLVDELAHRNLPGGRHERRWQDIAELLDAGIEVYTALNVQHLESLNDQVRRITGVTVRETVPDAFLDRARDIVLIDLPPRELIAAAEAGQGLRAGNRGRGAGRVLLADQSGRAARAGGGHHRRPRRQRSARAHAGARRRHAGTPRVLAAIDGHAQANTWCVWRDASPSVAVRRGASRSSIPAPARPARRERLDAAMRLARRLGGEPIILRGHAIADELIAHADREGVGQIILGRTRERLWRACWVAR
jgi:two-component system sensor histidine kinase KdpD